jgi:ribonucleoside-diphosphate reductase beta chain
MIPQHLIPVKGKYGEAPIEFANKQLQILWFPDEIKVEKDIQDILVNMTESERHGVITVLKLFTLYELFAGDEYWGTRFKEIFDDADMHRMAAVNAMIELAVHAPFYKKLNEALHIDNEDFYISYVNDPVLADRMKFIGEVISSDNDLFSLASFSMVEGAILYSSFAYLKHFQARGKNKLLNVVRGINFSVRDENNHSLGGAFAFKVRKQELNLTPDQEQELKETIFAAAKRLYEHECRITQMIFEKGSIDGITETQLTHFVQSRINECLKELGYEKLFDVKYNPIADWFYDGINGFAFNDFFSGMGNSYHRKWDENDFVW